MTAIAVLGTGPVGRTIGTRLMQLGHTVTLGSRSADNEAAAAWSSQTGGAHGTYADAARAGELLFNCTSGAASVDVLRSVDPADLTGKTLVDVGNAFRIVEGRAELLHGAADSLGEEIQRAFPELRVVKTLHTVNASVMVDPSAIPGDDHVIFVCGDHDNAKAETRELLRQFGWTDDRVLDLGGIVAARATEKYLPLWVALMGALGTTGFNIAIRAS